MKLDLFRVPLIKCTNLNTKKTLDIFHRIKNSGEGNIYSNRGGYQSRLLTGEECQNILVPTLMDPILKEIKNVYELSDPFVFQLRGAWFNENKKRDYNIAHIHPECNFALVWYLQVPEESGEIVFEHPDNSYLMSFTPYLKCNKGSMGNAYHRESYSYMPKAGDLIAFPSNLRHRVEPYQGKDSRISLAFNIKIYY